MGRPKNTHIEKIMYVELRYSDCGVYKEVNSADIYFNNKLENVLINGLLDYIKKSFSEENYSKYNIAHVFVNYLDDFVKLTGAETKDEKHIGPSLSYALIDDIRFYWSVSALAMDGRRGVYGLEAYQMLQTHAERSGYNFLKSTQAQAVRQSLISEYNQRQIELKVDEEKKGRCNKNHLKGKLGKIRTAEVWRAIRDTNSVGIQICRNDIKNRHITDVFMYDRTSAYPACILMFKYPMTSYEKVPVENYNNYTSDKFCYIVRIKVWNVELKTEAPFPMKIFNGENVKVYAKRKKDGNSKAVVKADYFETCLDNVQFDMFNSYYSYSRMELTDLYVASSGYMPEFLVRAVLQMYNDKTQYKNVEGKEHEYLYAKRAINEVYGLIYQNDMKNKEDRHEEVTDEDIAAWDKKHDNIFNIAWAPFIAHYQEAIELTLINRVGKSVIYADTDSIYSTEEITDIIEDYNKWNRDVVYLSVERYNLKEFLINDNIGCYLYDGCASDFIAKKSRTYIFKLDGKWTAKISGLGKEAINYMLSICDNDDELAYRFCEGMFDFPDMYNGTMITAETKHKYTYDKEGNLLIKVNFRGFRFKDEEDE